MYSNPRGQGWLHAVNRQERLCSTELIVNELMATSSLSPLANKHPPTHTFMQGNGTKSRLGSTCRGRHQLMRNAGSSWKLGSLWGYILGQKSHRLSHRRSSELSELTKGSYGPLMSPLNHCFAPLCRKSEGAPNNYLTQSWLHRVG